MNKYARESFLAPLEEHALNEMSSSVSSATEQAYQHDWNRFSRWCLANDVSELPAHPKTVAAFLEGEQAAGAGPATLNRRVAAISYMHRNASLVPPLAHAEADLIRAALLRPKAAAPRRAAKRPGVENWRAVMDAVTGQEADALRDRALIALHVSAAFRLLELARLTVGQVRLDRNSAQIHLGRFRSHTARGSSAITVMDDMALAPVSHLRLWMEAGGSRQGSLFHRCSAQGLEDQPLSEAEIGAIMAARARAAGYALRRAAGGLFQPEPLMAEGAA